MDKKNEKKEVKRKRAELEKKPPEHWTEDYRKTRWLRHYHCLLFEKTADIPLLIAGGLINSRPVPVLAQAKAISSGICSP